MPSASCILYAECARLELSSSRSTVTTSQAKILAFRSSWASAKKYFELNLNEFRLSQWELTYFDNAAPVTRFFSQSRARLVPLRVNVTTLSKLREKKVSIWTGQERIVVFSDSNDGSVFLLTILRWSIKKMGIVNYVTFWQQVIFTKLNVSYEHAVKYVRGCFKAINSVFCSVLVHLSVIFIYKDIFNFLSVLFVYTGRG